MPQQPEGISSTSQPGMERRTDRAESVPASAFWWQWPWSRIPGGRIGVCQPHASRVGLALQELLEQHRAFGDGYGLAVVGQQIEVVVAESQDAAWLQAHELCAALHEGVDGIDVGAGVPPGGVHHAGGEHGPPAALSCPAVRPRTRGAPGPSWPPSRSPAGCSW